MADSLFSDPAMLVSQSALDGLSIRQNLISQNISNVDTPGYRAQEVKFENALRQATTLKQNINLISTNKAHLGASDRSHIYQVGIRPGGSVRADGNNVDIDQELSQLTETGIQYQAISQVVSKKINLLRTIATAR